VERRFSDFEWLLQKLHENDNYKGLIIPPIPEKKYFGNLEGDFLEKRRVELENFLHCIVIHPILKFDRHLCSFLTLQDFDKYRSNPSAFEKVKEYYEQIPSVRNFSFSSLQDALQSSLVLAKTELQQISEPGELKAETDLDQKYVEIQGELQLLGRCYEIMKQQKEMQLGLAKNFKVVGVLLQRVNDLDGEKSGGVSERAEEEEEDESPKVVSGCSEYEHIPDSTNKKVQMDLYHYGELMIQDNPSLKGETYLKEKITKLHGVLNALTDRKSYAKSFIQKSELKQRKNEKLQTSQNMDPATVFEQNNDIEALNMEIQSIKKAVQSYNVNIQKEIQNIEQESVVQLKQFICNYAKANLLANKNVESYWSSAKE